MSSARSMPLRRAAIAGLIGVTAAFSARAETLPLPASLIGLNGEQGGALLIESTAHQAYWPLSIQFVTQKNQAFCGVATMVMVLNALNVKAPPVPEIEPFTTFTQDNLLNPQTETILPVAVLMKHGMTLDQFGQIISTFGATASVRHAEATNVDQFRELASKALAEPNQHVVVNYLRRVLGQEKGGHISPLAAYDAKADRFLLLDVSRYKYPPVWVKTSDLFAAMNTPDADAGDHSRGFVLVRVEH